MKTALIVLAVLIGIVALAVVVGMLLPKEHTASQEVTVGASPEAVWKTITTVDAFPSWRPDVKRVERLPDRDGRPAWIEDTSSGRITLTAERMEAPRLLVARIADPDLPFGGAWVYEIAPAPGGSKVRITENGEIYNPVFRLMARFVFGHEATMKSYLQALKKKLG